MACSQGGSSHANLLLADQVRLQLLRAELTRQPGSLLVCVLLCVLVRGSTCQTYPSIRGRTIFRAKDRLALTKSILDSFFDMGVLQARAAKDWIGCCARPCLCRRLNFYVSCISVLNSSRGAREGKSLKKNEKGVLGSVIALEAWFSSLHPASIAPGMLLQHPFLPRR